MILFQHKDPLFSIVHAKDDTIPSYQMHTHAWAELFCILKGSTQYYIEGNTYSLSDGDMLLIRPAEAHHVVPKPIPYERLYINFDIRIFDQLDPENQLTTPLFDRRAGTRNHYPADPACKELLLAMTDPDGSRATMLANLVLVLQRLCRKFGQMPAAEAVPDSVEYRMLHYINQNLHQELSVQLLCDKFFLSRAQLCRRFHTASGTSVGRYITAKRMLLARELLHQGQKPTDIYSACGYRDYATFYRAYTAFFEHTPREAVGKPLTEERHIIG